jgi:hypothetical protein
MALPKRAPRIIIEEAKKEVQKMCFRRDEILIPILLVVLIFFPMNAMSQGTKGASKIFRGTVVEISQGFITVGTTTIALPKETKVLDRDGSSISFETIKNGDPVSVTVYVDKAVVQRVSASGVAKGDAKVAK